MVATDSYRLAVKETQLDDALEGSLEANVPARTLQELARIAGAGAGDSDRRGRAGEPGGLHSRRRDALLAAGRGTLPELPAALPESYEHELRVSRDELLEVVRRVGLLAQKNAPLRLRFAEGALEVSAQTPDVARRASRCRFRSRANRESASTRSSCATGWRAPSPRS